MMGLDAFLEARRDVAFRWGSQDCATVAADWVLERTGRDPLADVRDPSLTVLQRLRVIHRAGGFLAIVSSASARPSRGSMQGAGDVVLVPSGHRGTHVAHKAFGLCAGSHLVAPGAAGLVVLPVTRRRQHGRCDVALASLAWRAGRRRRMLRRRRWPQRLRPGGRLRPWRKS